MAAAVPRTPRSLRWPGPSRRRRNAVRSCCRPPPQPVHARDRSVPMLVPGLCCDRARPTLAHRDHIRRSHTEKIAARERCSVRKVNMTISLAFLAPDLVKAAIEGRLPRGIGMTRLCDLPVEWTLQHQALGLAAP
jgi:hypothetical protein